MPGTVDLLMRACLQRVVPWISHHMNRLVLNRRSVFFVLIVSLSNCAADEVGDAVRSAIDGVSPSVLRIQIVGTPDRAGRISSRITTGVAVSNDGELVSSSFGFGGDVAAVFVETSSGERHSAEIVATDHVRKLVLLRAQAHDLARPVWATGNPAVGAWAVAVGRFYASPGPSASLGVVSAINRIHDLAIQTDAKVSPVNYGGPLVGMDGSVLGVLVPLSPANEATGVTAGVKWYDSGIGFAVPSSDVLDSVERLRSGNDRKHGVLGIDLTTQNLLSQQVEVQSVHPGSPAETGGIREGDLVISMNGRAISRLGVLQSFLKGTWAGDNVSIVVLRDGENHQIKVTLADELAVAEKGWLGIVPMAAAATTDVEGGGVLVGVLAGSPAAGAELPNPCIITMVDDVRVSSLQQIRSTLREIPVGVERKLTFSPTEGPADDRTVSVVAGVRATGELARLATEVASLRSLTTTESAKEWTQSKTDLKDQRFAWVIGPAEKLRDTEPGVVILLHDGEPVTDTLMQDWREVCQEHQIVLAVVYHDYAIPVESVETVRLLLAEVSKLGSIDPDRIALVTRDSHAAFVTRLLLDPRIRSLRQAVFIGCRPTIAGASLADVAQQKPSLLMFPSADDRQAQALLTSSAATLRNAGAEVLVSRSLADAQGAVQAGEIARWMLLQKIR